jgi:glyceraldehyde 3-phosphate dehydrogenase
MADKKIRVGINGLGRIGRAVLRLAESDPRMETVAVNDINPDVDNLAYLLKYDSHNGRLAASVETVGPDIRLGGRMISVFHEPNIADVPWAEHGVDLVVDASGVQQNTLDAPKLLAAGVSKVLVTHSPEEVDFTLIFGVNEGDYDPSRHHVVSCSICDAVAAAPVLKVLSETVGVASGFFTTMHPWLSYQNLLDGPSRSWNWPGQIYHHFAVGRSSVGTLIPKPTSAVEAIGKVLPEVARGLQCMSFRIPTPVVGSGALYLRTEQDVDVGELLKVFERARDSQVHQVFDINRDPLISVDFQGSPFSLTLDARWMEIADPRHLSLVLWYDNEIGYSSRVVDAVTHVMKGLKS